jgi:hypothetical protein
MVNRRGVMNTPRTLPMQTSMVADSVLPSALRVWVGEREGLGRGQWWFVAVSGCLKGLLTE